MTVELLITNIGYAVSILITFSMALFVLIKNPKEQLNIVYFLLIFTWVIYQLSYIVGINIIDPRLSRLAFMFNISTLFTSCLSIHLMFILTKSLQKMRLVLISIYTIATSLTIFFVLNPDRFLELSVPKIYYNNFFVLGDLYYLGDLFFYSSIIFFFVYTSYAYYKADIIEKNRLKYFIVAMIFAYGLASLPAFLLYGINIDPFLSFLAGPLYAIPMAYAIIRYDIIDIKIVAKRAMLYALSIGIVMFFFIIINFLNNSIGNEFPSIPVWVVPLISSMIAVALGVVVWNKIKEVDVLKYEFINIIMHKFRTPLTAVKWSLDTLTDPENNSRLNELDRNAINTIKTANTRLIDLTNTVAGLTFTNNKDYEYNLEIVDIPKIIEGINDDSMTKIKEKYLNITYTYDDNLPVMKMDKDKIKFALQTLIDNAVNYTPPSGKIEVSIKSDGKFIYMRVKDNGIGISKEDLTHVFSKFFRGSGAQNAYTEGMGIGLHLTQDIVHRHGGKIVVESEGKDRGTAITIRIPILKI